MMSSPALWSHRPARDVDVGPGQLLLDLDVRRAVAGAARDMRQHVHVGAALFSRGEFGHGVAGTASTARAVRKVFENISNSGGKAAIKVAPLPRPVYPLNVEHRTLIAERPGHLLRRFLFGVGRWTFRRSSSSLFFAATLSGFSSTERW